MRQILPYIAGAVIFVAITFSVMFHPTSVPPSFERGIVTNVDMVYFGPYPADSEFIKLKQAGVKRIISLLDPNNPAEKILLEKEKDISQRYHMEFTNYPISLVTNPGSKAIASQAAGNILSHPGQKTYVHCYTGGERTQLVRKEFLNIYKNGGR